MKSITIKGESVGKVATKALRNAGGSLRVIRRRSASTFFSRRKAFKNLVYTPNAHTVVIDLGDENHLLLSKRHSGSPCNR
jgi:large subunit ribosomal protein L25